MKGSVVDSVRFSGAGLFFAGAFVLAVLTGVSLFSYLRSAVPNSEVWVVSHDLLPGAAITAKDLVSKLVPRVAVPEKAVLDIKEIEGRRVRYGLSQGDVVRETHLVEKGGSDLGRAVATQGPEFRAVLLPGEYFEAVDRLLPGDKLELTGVIPVQSQQQNSLVAVPLGVATVLEIQEAQGQRDKSFVLVTLPAKEVTQLALAMRAGTVTVAVQGDGEVSPAQPMRLESLTGQSIQPVQPVQPAKPNQ